jgi:hypothetical protein
VPGPDRAPDSAEAGRGNPADRRAGGTVDPMNRPTTALLSAFEAVLVIAIGVGVALAPLTVMWALHYGFSLDWLVFWRAAVDIWLLGHGVDLRLTLDPLTAASLGTAGAAEPVRVTIAALGFALITVLFAVRAGRRIAQSPHRHTGQLAAISVFALLCIGLTMSAEFPSAQPSRWQGVLLPTLVFAGAVLLGSTLERLRTPREDGGSSLRDWIEDWVPAARAIAVTALRGGAAAAAFVLLISAIAVAGLVLLSYAEIITLYERLHADVLGGAVITLGELAFLPNLVVWTAAWFVGPGFALGTGSAVSPLATTLGPVPAIPLLGALPSGETSFGFAGLVVPVVAGFVAGAVTGRGVRDESVGTRAVTGLLIGAVGGALLGALAAASGGAAGPGRLAEVGPDPLPVALFGALEIGVAALLGMATLDVGRGRRRVDESPPVLSRVEA